MAAKRALHIALIPGDGIGKEVIPAARRVLEALTTSFPLAFTFTTLPAGFEHFRQTGTALPASTLETLRNECTGALFGAVSSPTTPTPGYSSPIVALRKQLDLYANVRPVKTVSSRSDTGSATSLPIDLVIVRENTEDLYVKEERTFTDEKGGKVAEAIKRISEHASSRIARMAGEIALRRAAIRKNAPQTTESQTPTTTTKPPSVTITHKSNVLSQTDGLFRSTAYRTLTSPPFTTTSSSSPSSSTQLQLSDQIIDSMFYHLIRHPSSYDVIVAPNLYGDLLSDAAAALVGSLGLVPSANVGSDFVVGEPCHGSAPDIAGQGLANPIAAIRSAGLMLEFLGEEAAAGRVYSAVDRVLAEGKVMSPDLGGTAGTEEVLAEVLRGF